MTLITFIVFLLGLAVGSFLNVVIDRLPQGKDVIRGRSHCDHCKHTLLWYELIPVLSWIVQVGRSRCCHKKLSLQYPLVELATGFGFVFLYQSSMISYIASLLLFSSLVALFVTDVKHEILPTPLLVSAGIGAFMHVLTLDLSHQQMLFQYIIPAGSAALFFFLLWFFSKGKAMGDGDVPLSFIIGLVCGYPLITVSLYVAFLTGAALGVILILRRKKTLKSHIPFGPFLIFATAVSLLYGQRLIDIWQHFISTGSAGFP